MQNSLKYDSFPVSDALVKKFRRNLIFQHGFFFAFINWIFRFIPVSRVSKEYAQDLLAEIVEDSMIQLLNENNLILGAKEMDKFLSAFARRTPLLPLKKKSEIAEKLFNELVARPFVLRIDGGQVRFDGIIFHGEVAERRFAKE